MQTIPLKAFFRILLGAAVLGLSLFEAQAQEGASPPAGGSTRGEAKQACERLDTWKQALPPRKTPEGWQSRKFSPIFGSGDRYLYRFDRNAEGPFLHLRAGRDNSFSVGNEREFDITAYRRLRWEWRVTQLPRGGDVRVKAKDDQAGSLCVLFDPQPFGFKSICYVWENAGPIDTPITSTRSEDARYLILHTGTQKPFGEWVAQERDVLADYRRLFDADPEDKAIVGISIDANDTRSSAEAYYRRIFFCAG